MHISVIIPTLNEQALVAEAVRRAWAAGADQVIVADGNSRDKTMQIAREAAAEVVSSGPGRGRQQHAGALAADGDVLVFLHVDNGLEPGSFIPLREAIESGKTVWGGFRQRIDAERRIYRWIEWGNAWRLKYRGLAYGDQAIFVTASLYFQVGGFPRFPLMEDVVLSDRLRRIARPRLLPGPLHVSARRWRHRGPIRQTAQNWLLFGLFRSGVSPQQLANWYSGDGSDDPGQDDSRPDDSRQGDSSPDDSRQRNAVATTATDADQRVNQSSNCASQRSEIEEAQQTR